MQLRTGIVISFGNMNTQQKAAETILDRGVRFKMPAPALIRFLRLNRLTIRPFRPGTILEFSRVVIEHDLEETKALEHMVIKLEPIAKCIAIAALNSRLKIKWFTKIYTRWLLWRCHYTQLLEMFAVLSQINSVQDFTSITKFFCQQTTMMMSPRNLGQENGR